MQCPDCGYIFFKQAKICGSCGFDFKKAKPSSAPLFRNDSFSIFSGKKTPATEPEAQAIPADKEEIAVIGPPEDSRENPSLESREFLLDLSDARKVSQTAPLNSMTFQSTNTEYAPLEFSPDADINLKEFEVEGLGLGLEPKEPAGPLSQETPGSEGKENLFEIIEEPEGIESSPKEVEGLGLDLEPKEPAEPLSQETPGGEGKENLFEIIEEPEGIESIPKEENTDSPIETAANEGPDLETIPDAPPMNQENIFEINHLSDIPSEGNSVVEVSNEPEPTPETPEEEPVQSVTEPEAPVLDLGEEELSLDLETESLAEPPPPPIEIEELDLNLEIDDSEGPLSTANPEFPEIKIEDLGLELEDPDTPPGVEKP